MLERKKRGLLYPLFLEAFCVKQQFSCLLHRGKRRTNFTFSGIEKGKKKLNWFLLLLSASLSLPPYPISFHGTGVDNDIIYMEWVSEWTDRAHTSSVFLQDNADMSSEATSAFEKKFWGKQVRVESSSVHAHTFNNSTSSAAFRPLSKSDTPVMLELAYPSPSSSFFSSSSKQ